MTTIRIRELTRDDDLQPRAMMNMVTVQEYAEELEGGAVFPPVVVYHDAAAQAYYLADGFHRVEAAAKIGVPTVEAEIRPGTKREAILWSVQANATHGLRRSDADKRKAVLTLLEDDEWAAWSDREIARRTATSHTFVAKVREFTGNGASEHPASERRYQTRHGTVATMNTAQIAASNEARANEDRATQGRLEDVGEATPAYAPIWQLERVINQYLDNTHGPFVRSRDDAKRRLASVDKLCQDVDATIGQSLVRLLPEQFRKGDVVQALNNVAGRLRHRLVTDPADDPQERQPSAWAPTLSPSAAQPVAPAVGSTEGDGVAAADTPTTIAEPEHAPESPAPAIPAPSEQIKPKDAVLTVRISPDWDELATRRVIVTIGDDGAGPAVFYRGFLSETHRLVDRALAHHLGGEVLQAVRVNGSGNGNGNGEEPKERKPLPFPLQSVVRCPDGQYGRVASFSSSLSSAYIVTTDGARKHFPVTVLQLVEQAELQEA